jgi:dTDP-4-amino-4,6-dideoxygalactose transaminase
MSIRVPLTGVTLGEEEALAAADVLRSGWVTQGERILAFEQAFARMTGASHALAVSNCTVGLELAYEVSGVLAGDEVVVPALTFVATANAAHRLGARPVFADVCSPDDLTIDPEDIVRCVTDRTRAVVAVHFGGFAADVDRIANLLAELGRGDIAIVEDCAHAPGASDRTRTRMCGTLGRVAAFSFFGNKNLTTGEGGMLTTSDEACAARGRLLRSHGMTTGTWDRHRGHAFTYDVMVAGTNARMDEMRAAIGLVQLGKLEAANAARTRVRAWYLDALAACGLDQAGVEVPFTQGDFGDSAQHLFVVLLPAGTPREDVMRSMREAGVQTSVHYPPTHGFRAYADTPASLPVTDAIAPRLLTLPLGPAMSQADVGIVLSALSAAL